MVRNTRKQKTQRKQRKQTGRGLLFANGGSCGGGTCGIPMVGGQNCRIGIMNPRYGGSIKKARFGGKKKLLNLTTNIAQLGELAMVGGGCGCGSFPGSPPTTNTSNKQWRDLTGGYRATKRNKEYLKKWKKGQSIGFTMRSSLKAKGLIPRSNGTYRVSPKYQTPQ
jgi:hypothetical protein